MLLAAINYASLHRASVRGFLTITLWVLFKYQECTVAINCIFRLQGPFRGWGANGCVKCSLGGGDVLQIVPPLRVHGCYSDQSTIRKSNCVAEARVVGLRADENCNNEPTAAAADSWLVTQWSRKRQWRRWRIVVKCHLQMWYMKVNNVATSSTQVPSKEQTTIRRMCSWL